MRYATLALAATTILGSAAPAHACGDKLAALAGGVRYERLTRSAYPARLVFYAPQDSALRVEGRQESVVEALEQAGHSVDVVATTEALDARLAAGDVDLVLAADGAPATTRAGAAVLVLRTASKPSGGTAAASPCTVTLGRRGARQVVRSVETVLEQRSRVGPAACAGAPGVQGV